MKMTANTTKSINHDDELTKPLINDVEKQQQPKTTEALPTAKKGMPCWCKCVTITLGLLFLVGAVTTMTVYSVMADAVEHLTVTKPHEKFPIVEMTEKELDVVKDRVQLFFDQLLAGHAEEPLTVTQDEINGFIGHSDYLRGNMFVTVKEGAIEEEYSLPTEMLPGGRGRFFVANDYLHINGDQLEVKMETAAEHHDWFDGPLLFAQLQYLVNDKMLELYLTKGSFFGKVAPQDWIDERQNLLEDLYNDPDNEEARAVLEGIERVTLQAGKIVVEPRKQATKVQKVNLSFPNVPQKAP
jgi:hypothetical protein